MNPDAPVKPQTADESASGLAPVLGAIDRLQPLLIVGPILAFLAACAYGVLEVHSSTDTWIGLACGRQILESSPFPTKDTFSFTAAGNTFFNQNWLTHVWQYWVYSRIGPNAVIYGTWAMSASIFVMTLAAAWFRTHHWIGAIVAATITALGCREFLSARPATTGFFLMAILGLILAALDGQTARRRWWPVALLFPLMLVWGHAHGSFMFGYGLLGVYLANWGLMRLVFPAAARIDLKQAIAIAAVMLAAVIATILTSPFGLDNFIHAEKIASSSLFRQVSEWTPPHISEWQPPEWRSKPSAGTPGPKFPPVWRFWWILFGSFGVLIGTVIVRVLFSSKVATPVPAKAGRGKSVGSGPKALLFTSPFDLFLIVLGLFMTFWARRFGPIFFLFAAPVFLVWILMLSRLIVDSVRSWLRVGVCAASLVASFGIVRETYERGKKELVDEFARKPGLGLLERVTRYDGTPHDCIEFLRQNELDCNLLVEWTQGGPIMFYAPRCRLFMDGRAQQVYEEETYERYGRMLVVPKIDENAAMSFLDGKRMDGKVHPPCDAVLLKKSERARGLWTLLERTNAKWMLVYLTDYAGLFLRVGSTPYQQLMARIATDTEFRPLDPFTLATRAQLLLLLPQPRPQQSWDDARRAIEADGKLGAIAYRHMANAANMLGRHDLARQYIVSERQRLAAMPASEEAERKSLTSMLDLWQKLLDTKAQP